ncbi:MAG: ATP-binding protein [Steroidobacteraceae bacterium]
MNLPLPGALRSTFGSLSSVRGKLTVVVLVTTAIALLSMTVALLLRDLSGYRESLLTDLTTEADIMALLTAPAMDFDDQPVAERNLRALSAKPALLTAALYSVDGNRYASYVREGAQAPPARLQMPAEGMQVSRGRMEITRNVRQKDEQLGVIHLSAVYDISGHVYSYAIILVLIMTISMVVALLLAAGLRRIITGPVEALVSVADAIVTGRNPSLRAADTPLEEFSVVVNAFNSVLDEADARTRELQNSHRALRRSEKLYRAIGESINYGVWVCDASGRNIYASDSFLRLVGMTQTQCSGMGWGDLLHPDDVAATITAWEECVRTGDFWYREHRFLGVDKHYHPILAQGVPMRDEDGVITGWAGINLDIRRIKENEDALREADRRKDDFLATLAHELRNPLAPIRHAAKLLGLKGLDAAQTQAARDIISRQVARMALLLDDLLEVSRITRGRLELRKERVSLNAVVNAAVETSKPLIESKKHTFSIRMPGTAVALHVDPLRMSQALSNLLTNAAKYTDPGGRIDLDIQLSDNELVLAVTDSGIGVPAAALPTIFEMFSQVDSAIDRAEGGLGIGLALVKGLVALHGGTVQAASDGPGKGSRFTIRIPADVIREATTDENSGLHQKAADGPRGRILVVDDNRDGAASLAMVLRSSGHTALTAHSGVEALQIGEQERPDAIVMDIGMPQMNGYEVARRIRASAWGKSVLLVALTGWGQKEDIDRAMQAGFDYHMTKPADPQRIEALLDEFLLSHPHTVESAQEN